MMTPPRTKKKPAAPSNPNFRGFLNLNLTDEDKITIKGTSYTEEDCFADLMKWIDSGFKFTFSEDEYNHCFQVIGTRQQKSHVDYGIMMSGRGSTPTKAFKQWIYMQTRLVEDSNWSDLLEDTPKFVIDD